jgi:hypothetical protein
VATGLAPRCSCLRLADASKSPGQSSFFRRVSTVCRNSTVAWGDPWHAAEPGTISSYLVQRSKIGRIWPSVICVVAYPSETMFCFRSNSSVLWLTTRAPSGGSLLPAMSRSCKCLRVVTKASSYVSNRQMHEDLGITFFASHIRALSESFESKFVVRGTPCSCRWDETVCLDCGPVVHPRLILECGEPQSSDTYTGKPKNSVPVPLYPPHIPLELTRVRTQASAARGRRLTAWAIYFVNLEGTFSYQRLSKVTHGQRRRIDAQQASRGCP